MTDRMERAVEDAARPVGGPNLGVLGIVSLILMVASLAVVAALAGGRTIPPPFGEATGIADFYSESRLAVRIGMILQLGSSTVLGIYAATAYTRQRRLGIRVPGPAIGLVGGVSAAVLLTVSACVTSTLSQPW